MKQLSVSMSVLDWQVMKMYQRFFLHHQDKGNSVPSFMASWLDRLSFEVTESDQASVEDAVKNVGATAFIAGVETVRFPHQT